MSDPWDKQTEPCDDGAHDRCPHFSSSAMWFNVLRRQVESGMGLCPCSCHSACPVATSGNTAASSGGDLVRVVHLSRRRAHATGHG